MRHFNLLLAITITLLLSAADVAARKPIPIVDRLPNASDIPEDEIEEYKWEEGEVKLPDYPEEGDLQEFIVDGADERFEYFIDKKSISIGKDDSVVRYTLVVRSTTGTGAENVFYEGIRCDSGEYKTYAFGVGDGKFKPFREPEWHPIENMQHMKYRVDLHEHYLCHSVFPRKPEEAINVIKHPQWKDYNQTKYKEWFR
jgi:hypothetical protein